MKYTLSAITIAVAILASQNAGAAEKKAADKHAAPKLEYGKNKFSGGIKVTLSADSNIAGAPAQPAGAAETGSDDDEDDFNLDDETDSDALDDVMDDIEVDNQDLTEDDLSSDTDPEPIVVGKGARDSDERMQTSLAFKHEYGFDKVIKWKNAFTLGYNSQHDRSDLSKANWAINTGPEFNWKSLGLKINPSISYLDLNVDNRNQLQSTVLSLASTLKVTKDMALIVRYSHEMRDNLKSAATDVTVDTVSVGVKYAYGKNLFSAAVSPKFEENDNGAKNKNKMGYELGYARKLPWKLLAELDYKYGFSDSYNVVTPGREDDDNQYGIKFTKNFDYGIYADLGAAFKDKNSNLNAKDTNSETVYVSSGWKF